MTRARSAVSPKIGANHSMLCNFIKDTFCISDLFLVKLYLIFIMKGYL